MGIISPFLLLPPLYGVIIVSFLVSLAINIAYKYLTDQKLMKQIKDELNDLQKQAKELPPEKALKLQKKALEVNMTYFKHSLKPTLFTMLPVLLVFMWMSSHFAFVPLYPDTEFKVTAIMAPQSQGTLILIPQDGITAVGEKIIVNNTNATFTLKGKEGTYLLEFAFNGKKYNKDVLITKEQSYAQQEEKTAGDIQEIRIEYQKPELLNLFGWKIGWLGTYIIFSLIFSLVTRKMLNVY